MIRIIRLLGAALGGVHRARPRDREPVSSTQRDLAAACSSPAWVVAWVVVGFAILPYLTVVPGRPGSIRSVQELSTAEFVTAVAGLLIGLLMGLLLGLPLSELSRPARDAGCRSAISICASASGWSA